MRLTNIYIYIYIFVLFVKHFISVAVYILNDAFFLPIHFYSSLLSLGPNCHYVSVLGRLRRKNFEFSFDPVYKIVVRSICFFSSMFSNFVNAIKKSCIFYMFKIIFSDPRKILPTLVFEDRKLRGTRIGCNLLTHLAICSSGAAQIGCNLLDEL